MAASGPSVNGAWTPVLSALFALAAIGEGSRERANECGAKMSGWSSASPPQISSRLTEAGIGSRAQARSQPSFSTFMSWIATAPALPSGSGRPWYVEIQQRYTL